MRNKLKIEELYNSYIDRIYKETETTKNISQKILKIDDKLWNTLNKRQKKLLDKWMYYETNRSIEVNKQTFIYAFSLATQLIIESLNE